MPRKLADGWLMADRCKPFESPPDCCASGGMAAGSAVVEALKKAHGDTATDKLILTIESMSLETPRGRKPVRKEDHQAMQSMYPHRTEVDPAGVRLARARAGAQGQARGPTPPGPRQAVKAVRRRHASALGSLLLAAAAGGAAAAVPLPRLGVDPAQSSVSGLSSGGYMAVQMHVAYSATFRRGAGIVAGGPYHCAEGSLVNALGRCTAHDAPIPVERLAETTRGWAKSGEIDPLAGLAGSKVYLWSGSLDKTVRPAVVADLHDYYRRFVPQAAIVRRHDVAAGHAMITDDYGSACKASAPPFIADCDIDLAGAMLKHLHGPLEARNDGAPGGSLFEFDQRAFATGHGLAATGWVYVPQACVAGPAGRCRLHVAFHGCRQNAAAVGQAFVRHAGYNRWADTNRIVVLYPQTGGAAVNGCWDWWGYDNAHYARKDGPQMAAVKAMVDQLASGGSPPSAPAAPAGVTASGATADGMTIAWQAVAGAAGYNVYRAAQKLNGAPVAATRLVDTGLAPGTAYRWAVTAVDRAGAESVPSAPAVATTGGTAPGPAPAADCFTANNVAHVSAGRAHVAFGVARANGSNESMGWWNVFVITTLRQTAAGHYVVGSCP